MTLTREQILAMGSGKELDKLVALYVMDCKCYYPAVLGANTSRTGTTRLFPLPDYSTDIAAAWEVAEHMQRKTLHFTVAKDATMMWTASFFAGSRFVRAITSPEAICKAALLASIGEG